MRIAFWSPMHGTGVTANVLAISLSVATTEDKSMLLTETGEDVMSARLFPNTSQSPKRSFQEETGIDGVIRYFKAGMLSRQLMEDCTTTLSGRLALLSGTGPGTRMSTDSESLRKIVGRIFDIAQDYYDWVVIDTESGYSEASLDTLNEADIVVINLRQNRQMLDTLFCNEEFLKLDSNKLFYLFGSYDPNSKYNLSNLRRMYKHINNSNSGGLPHCTTFMDAIADRRTLRYFSTGMVAEEYGEREFFKALEEVRKKLMTLAVKTKGATG